MIFENRDIIFKLSDCLYHDPFFGDEAEVILLSDKIVQANKNHQCHWCKEEILKNDWYRCRSELNREAEKYGHFRFCIKCCISQVIAPVDDCEYNSKRHKYEIPEETSTIGEGNPVYIEEVPEKSWYQFWK